MGGIEFELKIIFYFKLLIEYIFPIYLLVPYICFYELVCLITLTAYANSVDKLRCKEIYKSDNFEVLKEKLW